MAGYSLSDVHSLPDILATNNFRFRIPYIPGYGSDSKLSIKCLRASLPGYDIGRLTKNIAGMRSHHHGQIKYNNDDLLTVTYVEDSKLNTYNAIKKWQRTVYLYESNTSVDKLLYTGTGSLDIFDTTGRTISTFTFLGLFPSTITPIQLDGSVSQPAMVDVSFSFDLIE